MWWDKSGNSCLQISSKQIKREQHSFPPLNLQGYTKKVPRYCLRGRCRSCSLRPIVQNSFSQKSGLFPRENFSPSRSSAGFSIDSIGITKNNWWWKPRCRLFCHSSQTGQQTMLLPKVLPPQLCSELYKQISIVHSGTVQPLSLLHYSCLPNVGTGAYQTNKLLKPPILLLCVQTTHINSYWKPPLWLGAFRVHCLKLMKDIWGFLNKLFIWPRSSFEWWSTKAESISFILCPNVSQSTPKNLKLNFEKNCTLRQQIAQMFTVILLTWPIIVLNGH